MRRFILVLVVVGAAIAIGAIGSSAAKSHQRAHRTAEDATVHLVRVPAEDRFAPFGLTIHVGDVVKWVNGDEDDHTIVSDDVFTTAGHQGTNVILPADGGTFRLRFTQPGMFVYFCRFHAHLDAFHQPVAPGPDGGIQDANGNFGTPMSGTITVLPD